MIKLVEFTNKRSYPMEDCIVLRRGNGENEVVELSFPFHEDAPIMLMSIDKALALRSSLDTLIGLKLLTGKIE